MPGFFYIFNLMKKIFLAITIAFASTCLFAQSETDYVIANVEDSISIDSVGSVALFEQLKTEAEKVSNARQKQALKVKLENSMITFKQKEEIDSILAQKEFTQKNLSKNAKKKKKKKSKKK